MSASTGSGTSGGPQVDAKRLFLGSCVALIADRLAEVPDEGEAAPRGRAATL